MSYGIIRIAKYTAGSVKGLENHDSRAKQSHSNPDIDSLKTFKNYDLHDTKQSYQQFIKARIKDLNLKKTVRKDAIVMAQCLITSDKDFFNGISEKRRDDYFKAGLEFIKKRYGEENIISATVHLDEKTPHMHVNFVPVTKDGRLSAKDLLNKADFRTLQDDFYKEVSAEFGLERGVKGSLREHLEVGRFKRKTLNEEIKTLEENIKELENTPIIKDLEGLANSISDVKLKRKIFTENRVVLKESQFELLKQSSINFINTSKELSKVDVQNKDLAKAHESLLEKNEALIIKAVKQDGELTQIKRDFRAASKKTTQLLDIISEVVEKYPDVSKIVEKHTKKIETNKKQSFDLTL